MLHTPLESTSLIQHSYNDKTRMTTLNISVTNKHLLQLYRFIHGHFISLAFSDLWLRGFFEPHLQLPSQEPEMQMLKLLGRREGGSKNPTEEQFLHSYTDCNLQNVINMMYNCGNPHTHK